MRLSKPEFQAMNNPLRRFIQKHLEFRIFRCFLKQHNISLAGKVILDVGCGSGYSTKLIVREFVPSRVVAFDLMPEQIELAKKRCLKAEFFVGDITKTELPSDIFDAVFIFGILHHVPEWRAGLREAARMLKTNGVLLVEELSEPAVNFFDSLGFSHPREARFRWSEFVDGLTLAGFRVLEQKNILPGGAVNSFLCIKI